jgi:hypothetical protein
MINSDFDQINWEAGADPELRGKECAGCRRLLTYNFFDKNSSYKDGYEPLCPVCRSSPRLSMAEHTARLREMNYNSEGTRRQRHKDQEDFKGNRSGRTLDCSVFLQKLRHICPQLYVTQGSIIGDLALYVTSGVARQEWNGQSFSYLGYVTLGTMPEYSSYEWDEVRDILIRTKDIGWRSVLLRFVQNGILTEDQCAAEFGLPSGGSNSTWYKNLYRFRNAKAA